MYQNSYAYGRFLPQLYRSEVAGYSASVYTITNQAASVVYGDWVKDNAANLTISVTFFYTKTTDTPGSGMWNTQGGLAQHYSTTEHIIGTWIDGKPIYEKVITKTLTQNTGASIKAYPHNIPNVSEIVLVLCKENRPRPTNSSTEISIAANATELVAETGQDRSS